MGGLAENAAARNHRFTSPLAGKADNVRPEVETGKSHHADCRFLHPNGVRWRLVGLQVAPIGPLGCRNRRRSRKGGNHRRHEALGCRRRPPTAYRRDHRSGRQSIHSDGASRTAKPRQPGQHEKLNNLRRRAVSASTRFGGNHNPHRAPPVGQTLSVSCRPVSRPPKTWYFPLVR